MKTSMVESGSRSMSPSKLKLRMSVSCDNYLSEAKFALSRRDSVGSGSPHSSKGSPRRWAAKVDEIAAMAAMTEVEMIVVGEKERMTGDEPEAAVAEAAVVSPATTNPARSSSANELDIIVDLLGVPSDLLTQRDLNRRLFLLNEKKKEEERRDSQAAATPSLEECGKSKSYEDPPPSVVVRRRNKRAKKDIELKRRSVYTKDSCRGRSEAKTCQNCEIIANAVNDAESNREIFDVPAPKARDDKEQPNDEAHTDDEKELVLREEEDDVDRVIQDSGSSRILGPIRENIPVQQRPHLAKDPNKGNSRRFDSVRNLLEKARSILQLSKSSKSRQNGGGSGEEQPRSRSRRSIEANKMNMLNVEEDFSHTQSSPNTPLVKKKTKGRNRSFSPVK
jgi:hypothetical protein